MKNRSAILKFALVVVTFVLASGTLFSQPTVTINYNATGLTPGSAVAVPVVLNGTQVGHWQFIIRYDRDVLTYVSTTNTVGAPGLTNFSNTFTITAGPNAGEVAYKAGLVYLGGTPGYTYTNQTVFTINFIYNGGVTNLTFINISSGGYGINDTYVNANPYNLVNILTVYTNGSATGSYVNLESVATGDWKTAGTWSPAAVPTSIHNVFIKPGHLVTDTSTTGRCRDLAIDPNGKLTVAAGKKLTVNGNFLLNSDVTGTGSFIDLGTTTITGTKVVERYMTGNWSGGSPTSTTIWHYISSPVSGAVTGIFVNNLLSQWFENVGLWDTIVSLTMPMTVGKGYITALRTPGTIEYQGGNLNTGNQTLSGLTNTVPSNYSGWNLVGNPYPSAFVWNASVIRTNVDAAIYFWDPIAGNYTSKTPGDDSYVPATQAFFVKVTEAGTGSIQIPNTNRTHNGLFYKNVAENVLDLTVEGNGYFDQTSVRFNEMATTGFDSEYDAYKLYGIYEAPMIWSITEVSPLSINSLPDLSAQPVISLGCRVGAEGMYILNAQNLESFAPGTDLYIEDLLTGNIQDLVANPTYSFSAAAGQPEHRFNLHFSPVGMDEPSAGKVNIYSNNNTVFVKHADGITGEIVVYDMLGHEMNRVAIQPGILDKINLNVPSGYYVVKLISSEQTSTGKVFIR